MNTLRSPVFFDYLLLVLLAGLLGSSFLLMKVAVGSVPILYIVFFRLLVAFLILYAFMRLKHFALPSFREKGFWKTAVVLGFSANIIPFSLITWAEQTIDSNLAAIYMATIPIFTLIMAHCLTDDEKISVKKSIGVCVAFFGVVILLWQEAGDMTFNLIAQIACLIAAVFYAYSGIKIKKLANINPVVISTGVLLCGVVVMLPFVLYFEDITNITPANEAILAIVLLGVFPTALAFVVLCKLIADVGAVYTTNTNYLIPIFALFWGYIFLSELINERIIMALMFIMTGVFLVSQKSIVKK